MLYGQLIDQLCDRLKLDRKDASRPILGDKINSAYKEIANITNTNWEHLKRTGEIVLIPNYTTGTCTVTNGSEVVTFSGATLTASMLGRYFKPEGSSNWYKIVYISGNQATLLSPIQEDSDSGLTFIIWKRFYYFPSEVRKLLELGSWISNGKLTERSNPQIALSASDISVTGVPQEFTMIGSDVFQSEYSTGKITLTANSNVAAGTSSPAWLGNVEPGDFLEVGEQALRVKYAQDNDRLLLLNYASTTTPTPQIYTLVKEYNLGFQLYLNANRAQVLHYVYIKRAYNMVNEEKDRPELPEEFDLAILDGAEAFRMQDLSDIQWVNKVQLYSSRITDLKSSRFVSQMPVRKMSPRIRSRGRIP